MAQCFRGLGGSFEAPPKGESPALRGLGRLAWSTALAGGNRLADGVSSRTLIGLLSHTGQECPGAGQVVRPDRVEALSAPGPEEVAWLTDAEVASRLRALRTDPSAWRTEEDAGQLSLAGAQPKTALLRRDGIGGLPSGRTPTTLCQALGVHPRQKYESDGGPGAQAAVELLRGNSPRAQEDIDTFVGALVMSHLLGATDAHAKNYALLHGDTDPGRAG